MKQNLILISICFLFTSKLLHAQEKTPVVSLSKPNIIVIFTDDHGWADVGVHGIRRDIKTPNLDLMAGEGAIFSAGYVTAPQCIPSRAGILSGRYHQKFGVDHNKFSPMPVEVLTVPERLQKAGYTTGMVGKWHLEPNRLSEEWLRNNTYTDLHLPAPAEREIPHEDILPYQPGNQGFDDFFSGNIYNYWANFDLKGNNLAPGGQNLKVEPRDRLDIQSDAALAFIDRNHNNPFFLYLAYFAPHVPLASTEKYLARFPGEMPERRRYALAMISAVDDGLGRIREKLENHGVLDNTIIFFIADNGAPLKINMEDLPLTHKGAAWDGSLNIPFRGEKGMISEGGIRVPFIMSWPERLEGGNVWDIPVNTLDIGATVVELAGLEIDSELDGMNLLTLMADTTMAQQRSLYWRHTGQGAIRVGDWKYLNSAGYEYLFNLREDPTESKNLFSMHPERVESLRANWDEWNESLKRPFTGVLTAQQIRWYKHYFGQLKKDPLIQD